MGKYIEVQMLNLMEENEEELYEAFVHEKKETVNQKVVPVQKAKEVQTIQKTLGGSLVSVIPKVRTTDGHLMDWDREMIVMEGAMVSIVKFTVELFRFPTESLA